MTRTAVIIGAGISGMAASLTLARKGWKVSLLEQADALTEVGAGLQISANGMRVLAALGLDQAVLNAGFIPPKIAMVAGAKARPIFEIDIQKWSPAYVQILRSDLQRILLAAVEAQDGITLKLGTRVDALPEADLVLGADGVRSSLRGRVFSGDAPCYTGTYAWRTVFDPARIARHLPPKWGQVWALPGKHLVTTWVDQGRKVNIVGMMDSADSPPEDWRNIGDKAGFREDFGGIHADIDAWIDAADPLHCWALYDHPVLPAFHHGNVALIGDAAHPMLPSMAQGAVMALEDAWVLAEALQGRDVVTGLALYSEKRVPRTARVQKRARRNLGAFHLKHPLVQLAGYGGMWAVNCIVPGGLSRGLDWLYAEDVTA